MRYLLLLLLALTASAAPFGVGDPAYLQSASPLRRGLVGYWRLEEATGTRYDSSQYGNHLTANNSPTNAVGKVGNAASFVSASTQWLSAASTNQFSFKLTNSFSVCAWVNLVNSGTFLTIASKYDHAYTFRGWWLSASAASGRFELQSTNGARMTIDGTTALKGVGWKFISATYDGSGTTNGMNYYINGVKEGVYTSLGTMTDIDTAVAFTIGRRSDGLYVDGSIDEFGIFNRSLSSTEILKLYNSGLARRFGYMNTP